MAYHPRNWHQPDAEPVTTFYLIRWSIAYRLAATGPVAGRPAIASVDAFPTRADAEAAVKTTLADPADFFTIDITPSPRFPGGTQYSPANADHLFPCQRYYGPWDTRPAIERCYDRLLRQSGTGMIMTRVMA